MNRDEARRMVADAVLAEVASQADPDKPGTLADPLGLAKTLERMTPEDKQQLLVEALDLATYLGAWVQDFGASVQLVFGALPVGAGLPPAPTAGDLVREWRLGEA